jgi:hypothetical protein
MSVGSGTQGGVTGLFVWDLSIDGEDSSNGVGLRIKTSQGAGGEVSAAHAKVCIQREKQPIVIDPFQQRAKLDHGVSAESTRHPLPGRSRGKSPRCEVSELDKLEQRDE